MTKTNRLSTAVSENFVAKILREADFSVTPEQRELIQGYFVAMDHYLTENNISWNDIIVDYKLAQDLMVRAQMGFDMRSEAMLYPVARKDNKVGGKLRFTIQKGYKGYVFEAKKYAAGTVIDIDAHWSTKTTNFAHTLRTKIIPMIRLNSIRRKMCSSTAVRLSAALPTSLMKIICKTNWLSCPSKRSISIKPKQWRKNLE